MQFKVKPIGIEMGHNEIVLNEASAFELDLSIADRVKISFNSNSSTAMVDISKSFVAKNEIGLFPSLMTELGVKFADTVILERTSRPQSLEYIRKKLDGLVLSQQEISQIITDLMSQSLSTTELAAFIAAVYTKGLSTDETAALTEAIISSGEIIVPPASPAVSEHSIGGVAGGRASMITVPILTSLGFCVPKTASRAISSASATADVMEVFCPVALSVKKISEVLKSAGGCIVWGGGVNIAAADDKLIQIRNPLHLDPQPLLVASILAKKKAEGSKYVVLDIPVGRGVKIDTVENGRALARAFEIFAARLGIKILCTISDGSQPMCDELGPNLEAKQVLTVLMSKGKSGSPRLLQKSCEEAGVLIHMVRGVSMDEGYKIALQQIESGRAYEAFKKIIAAQGGNSQITPNDIQVGQFKKSFYSNDEGTVSHIDNKAASRILRGLGAPKDKSAGLVIKVHKGEHVVSGQEIFQIIATTQENLDLGSQAVDLGQPLIELTKVVFAIM